MMTNGNTTVAVGAVSAAASTIAASGGPPSTKIAGAPGTCSNEKGCVDDEKIEQYKKNVTKDPKSSDSLNNTTASSARGDGGSAADGGGGAGGGGNSAYGGGGSNGSAGIDVVNPAEEEPKERHCDSLIMCIITTLNEGLRNGGGIGDVLRKPSSEVSCMFFLHSFIAAIIKLLPNNSGVFIIC